MKIVTQLVESVLSERNTRDLHMYASEMRRYTSQQDAEQAAAYRTSQESRSWAAGHDARGWYIKPVKGT